MVESKDSKRGTKNSQRVASLEDQNKVLEEVLKASREAGGKNKTKSNQSKSDQERGEFSNDLKNSAMGSEKKRKADVTESSPAKKAKNDDTGDKDPSQEVNNPPYNSGNNNLILQYPDYEANRESDFDEGRQEMHSVGDHDESQTTRRQPANVIREHVISSEEEDDFDDPNDDDVYNDMDYAGSESWDNHSIASSTIFPSESTNKLEVKIPKKRPDSIEPSSRPPAKNQNKDGGHSPARTTNSANIIENLVKERAGVVTSSDKVGPPVPECIAELLKAYLKEPNAENTLKLLESYPRPENAEWVQAPTLGTQVAASIPKRSNNYDKRLRQSQLYVGGSLSAMASVLEDIMYRGKTDPSLMNLAKKVMDAKALSGYVHWDFNAIRKGAIRQVINPSYAGVFTRRTSSTPQNLMGENSVPEQLKEQDEISKVRAKLQKPKRGNREENRQDFNRNRGRGQNPHNRGNFANRSSNSNHNSGFGHFQNGQQRGGRGQRSGYPNQRRVYGQQNNNQDQNGSRDQKNN